jgi:hypothetical protein
MTTRVDNPAPGLRGFVFKRQGQWLSASSEWNPRLKMRLLRNGSGKFHDTLEEAYERASSMASATMEPPC